MLGTGLSVPLPGGAHHPCLWVCFGRFSASSERDPREVMYLPGIPRHPAPRGAASCPPRHAASVTKATSRDQVLGKRVPRGDEQDHLHVTISVGPEQTAGWPVFIFLRNNNPWKDINYTFFFVFCFCFLFGFAFVFCPLQSAFAAFFINSKHSNKDRPAARDNDVCRGQLTGARALSAVCSGVRKERRIYSNSTRAPAAALPDKGPINEIAV